MPSARAGPAPGPRTRRRGLLFAPMPPARRAAPSPRARERSLRLIHVVAIVEAVLLVFFLVALATGSAGAVSVVGPAFGIAVAYLVYLAATGAGRGMWGWWFPALARVT